MTVALLTSQQPVEALRLGGSWAREGDSVTVVLLDAATAILRPGHEAAADLESAHAAGVGLWAHDVSVAERALELGDIEVEVVDLDAVAALIGDPGTSVQWW